MKRKQALKWLLRIAAAIVFLCGILYLLWYDGRFLPAWISWQKKGVSAELEQEPVHLQLSHRKLVISDEEGKTLWTSDSRWRVSDFIVGDIDHDEQNEVVLLVWKIGSYGKYLPFWVKKDENTWSQHIFIYDWDPELETRMRSIWMSSKMGIQAADWFLDEKEILHIIKPDGEDTRWLWSYWGLELLP